MCHRNRRVKILQEARQIGNMFEICSYLKISYGKVEGMFSVKPVTMKTYYTSWYINGAVYVEFLMASEIFIGIFGL